jgi:hypothetical protein
VDEKPCEFSATIRKAGINPYVGVPKQVSTFFGKRGNIPVHGILNGMAIRATLVPVGGGRHRLYVNGDMRKKANVKVGDRIQLALKLDTQLRTVPMPEEFASALRQNKQAEAAFERLPPSRRKEILSYLNYLKKPESLKRNIDKVLKILVKPEDKPKKFSR